MAEIWNASWQFPTVIFTVLAAVAAIMWLVTLSGFGDLDDAADGLFGDAIKPFGLADVPVTVTVTVVAVFGWAASVLAQIHLLDGISGAALFAAGAGVLLGSVVAAVVIAALVGPLLAKIFETTPAHQASALVGRVAHVRSAAVTDRSGYGDVRGPDDNIDRVDLRRIESDDTDYTAGDPVLIIDYDPGRNVYLVSAWRDSLDY